MTAVNVYGHVGQGKLLNGVDDESLVCLSSVRTHADAHVGDQVGKGIGLDSEDHGDIREVEEDGADRIDELRLVESGTAVGDGELTAGCSSGTVAVRKIVDDEGNDHVLDARSTDTHEVSPHVGDRSTSTAGKSEVLVVVQSRRIWLCLQPSECGDIGNLCGSFGEDSFASGNQRRDGAIRDPGGVVGVWPLGLSSEGVSSCCGGWSSGISISASSRGGRGRRSGGRTASGGAGNTLDVPYSPALDHSLQVREIWITHSP